jgi:hypothetical protein
MKNLFNSSLLAILLACSRAANLDPVELGAASGYALLAGTAITSTGASTVTGDIGVFPGTAVTGFGLGIHNVVDKGNFDPSNFTGFGHFDWIQHGAAQGDLTKAYNDAAGKNVSLGGILSNQDLGGMTLLPGVYKFGAAAALNGVLTLDAGGDVEAAW